MASTAPARSERHRWVPLLLLAALLSPACGSKSAHGTVPAHTVSPLQFKVGDDPGWAAERHAAGWTSERPRHSPNWWFRTTVGLDRDVRSPGDLALRVLAPGSVEVYWDGVLVGREGTIGTDASTETPGRYRSWSALDADQLTGGEHVVAVRASSHRMDVVRGKVEVLLLDRRGTELFEGRRTAAFSFCAGLLFLTGIVFAGVYRPTGAHIQTLLFAVLVVSVALLLLLEYSKYLWDYTYPWHFPRLVTITGLTWAVGCLLPAFVAAHLGISRRGWLVGGLCAIYAVLMVLFIDPDEHSLYILQTSVVAAFVLAAIGVRRKRADAGWILLAVTANLVPAFLTGFRYADHWFFVGFLAMVAVLLAITVRTLRRQARQRTEALLAAERLRYELLRKTIQPHFLMNSLSVSISHVEEHPQRGIAVLRDLAEELEAFLRIGEQNRTTVREELDLCLKHVRTMAHLLDLPLELRVAGEAPTDDLPPGVLLTLVENAITHGDLARDPRIAVRVSQAGGRLTIEVRNRAANSTGEIVEGAGLRYVRAQFRQGRGTWAFDHGLDEGYWWARIARSPGRRDALQS